MELSRRDFLKASGAGIGGIFLLGVLNPNIAQAVPPKFLSLKKKISETTTICCYCAVGCGAIVTSYEDGTIKIEGDPDHPINEGTLCSKGLAMAQIHEVDGKPNPYRLTRPLYRAPNGSAWEEKDWDWVLDTIAKRVKATRDATFNKASGRTDFAFLDKERGSRWLLCSRCDTEWLFQRLQCPYCGTQDQNALAYFTDDEGLYRLYVCERCKRYLKVIDLRRAEAEVLLPLERLYTLDIDRQAQEQGYSPYDKTAKTKERNSSMDT